MGILKIADGLENKKLGEITNIKLIYDKKNNISEFILTLKISDTDNKSNIMRAIRKKDLFEIGFINTSDIQNCINIKIHKKALDFKKCL